MSEIIEYLISHHNLNKKDAEEIAKSYIELVKAYPYAPHIDDIIKVLIPINLNILKDTFS